ncbi:MAG: family 43 glycosylhydrolase [Prevotella sp.]|nr:family 43 glycosylhydrolase [Prevotella sp.]
MKLLTTLLTATLAILSATAQTQLTTTEAQSLFQTTTKARVSIHDPSVVFHEGQQRYYIFGSHKVGAYTRDMKNWTVANPIWRTATTYNASNADAFVTPAVKQVTKGGQMVTFPAFNALDWSARHDSSYDINGNMWAPDVVYNPVMKKWCYYLSINGNDWHSSIILLTSDNITGPYLYQGPVVTCGFKDSQHSYKETDLELAIGTQSSLPSRYNVGSNWGKRWPHTIDPAVFYDGDGNLWLTYGSWSGGIWMLQLDENTGLRDYDVTYPSINGSSDQVTSDPYFGKKVAGGIYVSGEGPYIERIGNYYYLFVSYGFYSPDGGYEMRVFRSTQPDGPYTDANGTSAIFPTYKMNYGRNGDTRGEKIMGAYNHWGDMTVGECAQGHNSIIAANDGKTYLVYHTKFNDGTIGHQVRVHQVFVNTDGWLVAAPFEYNGEAVTDTDIATKQPFSTEEIAGTYDMLLHKYGMDYAHYEEVTPQRIKLGSDGQVTGSLNGSWAIETGTGYITLTLGGGTYKGVMLEEEMDGSTTRTVSFTACSQGGVNIWGYKRHPKYELAWQVLHLSAPVSDGQAIMGDIDLQGFADGLENVTVTWTSSRPDIISDEGVFDPVGLTEDTPVTLTLRMETPGYYWTESYTVTALSETNSLPEADWMTGLLAHYGFDNTPLANSYNANEVAVLKANGTATIPTLDTGRLQEGKSVHLYFGINGNESHVQVPNPLLGQTLEEGATISMWVNRTDNNLWDALFGFVDGNSRFYMTGNTYVGYNNGAGNWIDLNHPNSVDTGHLSPGEWHLATLVVARGGITLYVDGEQKVFGACNGSCNGSDVSNANAFDYTLIVDHLARATEFYLGRGSFWGSADARIDDLLVYNRPLSADEASALYQMESRTSFDFASVPSVEREMLSSKLALIRALNAIPHSEDVAGVDNALDTSLSNIEAQMAGNGLLPLATLLSEAEQAAFTFLSQATPIDPEQPFDLTFLLRNPDMESTEGWSNSPTLDFSCAEYYQTDFDFHQTVSKLPAGTYQFRSNAFQRPGRPENCTSAPVTADIYLGNDSRQLAHITAGAQAQSLGGGESYVNGKYIPNNMEAASIYFGKGLYENKVTSSLLTDRGQLTMGIRGTNHDAFHWCIFDHFRLHYFGSLDPQWVDGVEFKMGDVNCDGDITITDVTCLVSYLLGTPQHIFCHRAADLDGSGQHTITDVTCLVNLVLNAR